MLIILKGWTVECLKDWKSYLKLAIPGYLMLLLEIMSFEIGVFFTSKTYNE